MSAHHAEEHTSENDALHSLYERCIEEIKQRLEQTATLSAETFQAAAYAVRDHLAASMDGQQDELNNIIEILLKQWEQVFTHGDHVRQNVHDPDAVQVWAERGVSLLANLAGTVRTFAGDVERHLQRELEHRTGTIVGTGNFFCTQCDKVIKKVKTGPLPPCSRCRGTVFRRR
jgi:predicted PP-loop superfamily ATPase